MRAEVQRDGRHFVVVTVAVLGRQWPWPVAPRRGQEARHLGDVDERDQLGVVRGVCPPVGGDPLDPPVDALDLCHGGLSLGDGPEGRRPDERRRAPQPAQRVLLVARVLRHPGHGQGVQRLEEQRAHAADEHRRQVGVDLARHPAGRQVGLVGVGGDGRRLLGDADGTPHGACHVPAGRAGQAADQAERCSGHGAAERRGALHRVQVETRHEKSLARRAWQSAVHALRGHGCRCHRRGGRGPALPEGFRCHPRCARRALARPRVRARARVARRDGDAARARRRRPGPGLVGARRRRRSRRAARGQRTAHRPGAHAARRGATLDAGRLHAERRGERAPCPSSLPAHLRHVRDVPGLATAARRRADPLGSRVRDARPRLLPLGDRRAGSRPLPTPSRRRRSSPSPAPTSCAGSTASSS